VPVNFRINKHVVLPFGCPKWDINNIRISGVSTEGTYFSSDTKCAYIDMSAKQPLRIAQFLQLMPDASTSFPKFSDPIDSLCFMRDFLISNCEVQTAHEKKFLSLYFDYILGMVIFEEDGLRHTYRDINWLFWALIPLPQAHLYARDPFVPWHRQSYHPERMFKVDFAFWTGTRLVAVEIDGGSHIGNPNHVIKDRMLSRAGVLVVHILNDELDQHSYYNIMKLLPDDITEIWEPWSDGELDRKPPVDISNPLTDEIPF
jgi:hypothetical protein